jgi:hypothetical protein
MRHSPWFFAIVPDRWGQQAAFLFRKIILATDP